MSESTELQRAVETLTGSIDKLYVALNDLVRKDVYAADEVGRNAVLGTIRSDIKNVADDVADLKKSQERAEDRALAQRRLILTAFVLPFLLIVVQVYLSAQVGH